MATRPKKPHRLYAGLALILMVGVSFIAVLDAVVNPWAHSWTGVPTLTGRWLGAFSTPSGAQHTILLELAHSAGGTPGERCSTCPGIEGHAITCDRARNFVKYDIWGDVEDWRGTAFLVNARKASGNGTDIHLGPLPGIRRGDELHLTTRLIAPGHATTTSLRQSPSGDEILTIVGGHPETLAPITIIMRRSLRSEPGAFCP